MWKPLSSAKVRKVITYIPYIQYLVIMTVSAATTAPQASGSSANPTAKPVVKLQEMDPAVLEFAISKAVYAQVGAMI